MADEETRASKITVVMTQSQRVQFAEYAARHRWSMSTAVLDLALKALAAERQEER